MGMRCYSLDRAAKLQIRSCRGTLAERRGVCVCGYRRSVGTKSLYATQNSEGLSYCHIVTGLDLFLSSVVFPVGVHVSCLSLRNSRGFKARCTKTHV